MTARSAERGAFARDAVRAFLAEIPGEQALPGMPSPSPEGPHLPTRADLDAATSATSAALADPAATLSDVYRVAEAEEATLKAYLHQAEAEAELEAGI